MNKKPILKASDHDGLDEDIEEVMSFTRTASAWQIVGFIYFVFFVGCVIGFLIGKYL